ncbi:hypothetical protein ACQY0O_005107 [Thecaphora frezii]
MPGHLSSTPPFETFKITLHGANEHIAAHRQLDRTAALQNWIMQDILGGSAWSVGLSRAYPVEPGAGSSDSTLALGDRPMSDHSNVGGVFALAHGCGFTVRLVAVPTRAEDCAIVWERHVDVTVDASFHHARGSDRPRVVSTLRCEALLGPRGSYCDFFFPLTGPLDPGQAMHDLEIDFVFTIHGHNGGAPPWLVTDLGGGAACRPDTSALRDKARPLSASSNDTTTAPFAITAIRTNGDAANDTSLPEAALNTIASTLADGVWGDVCFVLKDPSASHAYSYVYGNSKLIGQRSLFLRHLIAEAGRSSVQAAIDSFAESEAERGAEDARQRFPHEVADSDFCADADGALDGPADGFRPSTPTMAPSRFVEHHVGAGASPDASGQGGAEPPHVNGAANGSLGTLSPAGSNGSLGRSRKFGRFRSRRSKGDHGTTLDEAVDLFNIRLDEAAASYAASGGGGTLVRAGSTRYVAIRDAAVTTFKRVIFWLETDQIVFAPLSSHHAGPPDVPNKAAAIRQAPDAYESLRGPPRNETRDGFIQHYLRAHPSHPAPASAKSIYRLAGTYQLVELQDLALAHIRSQLRPSNILRELFSPFTLRYPEVREMQLDLALQHWDEIKSKHSANLDRILEQSHFTPEASRLLGRMLSMATMDVGSGRQATSVERGHPTVEQD